MYCLANMGISMAGPIYIHNNNYTRNLVRVIYLFAVCYSNLWLGSACTIKNAIQLPGAYKPIVWKHISKYQKVYEKDISTYIQTFYIHT
jgi:hypothetical protein